ncbi:MAG: hypothetical protein ACREJB_07390, partial [Planctomycetaceae bacterium]
MRRFCGLCFLFACALGPLTPGRGESPPAVATHDDRRWHGRLHGDSPHELRFESHRGAESVEARELTRIDFRGEPLTPHWNGPTRRFRLRTGETITGSLIALDDVSATIAVPGGNTVTMPAHALAMFGPPEGERDAAYADFTDAPSDWTVEAGRFRTASAPDAPDNRSLLLEPGTAVACRVRGPVPAGRVTLRFREPEGASGRAAWSCVLTCAEDDGRPYEVRFQSGGAEGVGYRVDFPVRAEFRQPLRPRTGWVRLMVLFDQDGIRILVGEDLLASADIAGGLLTGLRIERDEALPKAPAGPVW